jgi:hypothetical protein
LVASTLSSCTGREIKHNEVRFQLIPCFNSYYVKELNV